MPSLREIRRDLAERHFGYKPIRTGVRLNGAYSGTASGTHARRRIVSSDLAKTRLDGAAAEADSTEKNFTWIFAPDSWEQRRIVTDGYASSVAASTVLTGYATGAGSEYVGYLTVDAALDAALGADTEVEEHGRFPVLQGENLPSLHWGINEALQLMHWPFKISISGTTGTQRVDLKDSTNDLWWLTRPDQLVRVFSPQTDDTIGPDPQEGPAWIEPDGQHMWLYYPERIATGQTFTAQLRRSLHSWIKDQGVTWRDSTSGLVNDTDECLGAVDRISAVAYAVIARRMAEKAPKPQRDGWATEATRAEDAVKSILEMQVEAPTPTRQRQMRVPRRPQGGRPMVPVGYGRRWP